MSLPNFEEAFPSNESRRRQQAEAPRVYYYRKETAEIDEPGTINKERFTEIKAKKIPVQKSESFVLSDNPTFKKLLFPGLLLACILIPAFILSSLYAPPYARHHYTHPAAAAHNDVEFKNFVKDNLVGIKDKLDNTVSRSEFSEQLERERRERVAIRDMIVDLRADEFVTQEKLENLIEKRLPTVNAEEIKRVVEKTIKEKASEMIQPLIKEEEKKFITHIRNSRDTGAAGLDQAEIKKIVQSEIASSILPTDEIKQKLVEDVKSKYSDSLLSKDEISQMIEKAIDKYAADQTALPDFALAVAGAEIVHSKTSTRYFGNSWWKAVLMPFTVSHPPSTILESEVVVGKCWAFPGAKGHVTIKLSQPIRVEAVTLDHIDHRIAHQVQSAPKTFQVWGFKDLDDKGVHLGSFSFDVFSHARRTFPVEKSGIFRYITLEVTSNFGHPDYTCIYRFRVHGSPL